MMAGITDPIPAEDAHEIVGWMVMSGRVPPAHQWVDEIRLAAEGNAFQSFGV